MRCDHPLAQARVVVAPSHPPATEKKKRKRQQPDGPEKANHFERIDEIVHAGDLARSRIAIKA